VKEGKEGEKEEEDTYISAVADGKGKKQSNF